MTGIIGKKIGMTHYYKEDGTQVPVTLIEAGPCPILQIKTLKRDGYSALQLGFGEKRESLINKPIKGHLKRSKRKSVRVINEIRIEKDLSTYKEGDSISIDIFAVGDYVDISGITIGKGFQGGMKRWGWGGGKKSHGSMHHRRVGSIGASSYPSKVEKGHHMPGRMGGVRRTVQNLEIVIIDKEKHLLAIKGSLPGNENSYLIIREAKKMPKAKSEEPKPKDEKAKEAKK